MPIRFRARDKRVSSGGYYVIGPLGGTGIASYNGSAGVREREECSDYTSTYPYPNNPLHLVDYKVTPLRLSGNVPYSFFGSYFTQYHAWTPGGFLYQYAPMPIDFDMQYWVTKALASLNPSKPLVDLPLFLFEFKDFPRLMGGLGDILARRKSPGEIFRAMHSNWTASGSSGFKPTSAHDAYLASTYGWEPLYADLMSLIGLAKAIEDRIKYLQRIEQGAHIQRSLGGGSVEHAVVVNGGTYGDDTRGTLITADVSTTETMKAWFTANVRLLDPLPPPSELPEYVLGLLLNLNLSKAALWNAIPWSFLIDYFANLGTYMETYRGYVRYSVTEMCVMVKQEVESSLTNVKLYPGCSYTGGRKKTTAKWRSVYAVPTAIVAADPFLSGRQLFNIGALATAGTLRKFR